MPSISQQTSIFSAKAKSGHRGLISTEKQRRDLFQSGHRVINRHSLTEHPSRFDAIFGDSMCLSITRNLQGKFKAGLGRFAGTRGHDDASNDRSINAVPINSCQTNGSFRSLLLPTGINFLTVSFFPPHDFHRTHPNEGTIIDLHFHGETWTVVIFKYPSRSRGPIHLHPRRFTKFHPCAMIMHCDVSFLHFKNLYLIDPF